MTNYEKIEYCINNIYDIDGSYWMYEDITPKEIEPDNDENKVVNENFHLLKDAELVASYGGEGQGDQYYTVYHFKQADVYIQFYGHYASHYGTDYQGMFEVKPKEKTITVYEQIS
jgi:hypothetical protein